MGIDEGALPELWKFDGVELNPRQRQLRVGGHLVELSPKPFDVLVLLLKHAGELLTTDEILEAVWTGRVVYEGTVASTISKIRKAIGDENQTIIVTVAKTGYRFAAPVERAVSARSPLPFVDLKPGSPVVGREQWILKERLGSGGYGDAWLAEHNRTAKNRVFKFCLDGERLSALKREVTLYRLLRRSFEDFQGFVPILEWNFDYVPYFVESEYAGDNLRAWAQGRGGLDRIPLADRISLVAEIAAIVATAHTAGVLHKDLKPENVLIEEIDGCRRVCLCDFGVGRLMDGAQLAELGITKLGFTDTVSTDPSTSGTLFYIAPELLTHSSPSIQSDVYALGVLLYQLVVGDITRPMTHGWEDGIEDELLRLDIAEATHGDRNRRMASAQTLADRLNDLQKRKLESEERRRQQRVAAENQAAVERARVRKPWLMTAVVILFTALCALSYTSLRIRKEAQRAELQAQRADTINSFLSDILTQNSVSAPSGAEARNATAEQLLDRAAKNMMSRMQDTPALRADLLNTMAHLYHDLGMPGKATPLAKAQLEAAEKMSGADAASAMADAHLNLGTDLWESGHVDEGRAELESALKSMDLAGDRTSLNRADVLHSLGMDAHLHLPASNPLAEQRFSEALAITERYHPDNRLRIGALLGLAKVAQRQNKPDVAEARYRQALALAQTHPFIDDDPSVAADASKLLGHLLMLQGKMPEAEQRLRDAVAMYTRISGPDNPRTLNVSCDLGVLLQNIGKTAEAEALITAAVQSDEKLHDSVDLLPAENHLIYLGGVEYFRGELQRADEVLAHAEGVALPDRSRPTQYAGVLSRHIPVLLALGRNEDAQKEIVEATNIFTSSYGKTSDYNSDIAVFDAELKASDGRITEAADELSQIVNAAHAPAGGVMRPFYWRARWDLVELRLLQGQVDGALRQAQALVDDIGAAPDAKYNLQSESFARLWLGVASLKSGRFEQAETELRRVEQIRLQLDDADSPWLAETRLALATGLSAVHKNDEARERLATVNAVRASHPELENLFKAFSVVIKP